MMAAEVSAATQKTLTFKIDFIAEIHLSRAGGKYHALLPPVRIRKLYIALYPCQEHTFEHLTGSA
jgi:hypothetical protein